MMITEIGPQYFSDLQQLLEAVDLPAADIHTAQWEHLVGYWQDQCLIAAAGLEKCDGNNVLLRSVVTKSGFLCQGYAKALVAVLHQHAIAQNYTTAWLLTTTAEKYFSKHFDYVAVPRMDATQCIVESAQYSDLCPGDAVLMKRALNA